MKHNTPKNSSVEKVLDILVAFLPDNSEKGTVDLSQKLDLHPATVNRLLQILAKKNFIRRTGPNKKFTLGLNSFLLGQAVLRSISDYLLPIAIPHLENLADRIDETVILELPSDHEFIVAYIARAKTSLSIGPRIGDRLAWNHSPGAKAIIAFSKPAEAESYFQCDMRKLTSHSIMDREVLRKEIETVKRDGVGFCREEMADHVNAAGVPILNHEDAPIAAIVVAGLEHRVICDPSTILVKEMKQAALDIEKDLFRNPPSAH